jgi:two-component system, OmpR family, response regulator
MRVLMVEDEARFADGLRRGLEADGFAVDIAADGPAGLELARRNTYDVIMLDLMLPCIDGFAVCRALRAEQIWTPILVLTARLGQQDEVDALDTGADGFLTKPFAYTVLVAHLRAMIRRGAPERPAVLEAGDLRLDPATGRAARGEVDLVLTVRERSLLEYLLRRRGELVSKREIIEHVWNDDFRGDPNIVEVYVGRLRNTVDRPFGRSFIQTVRGAGYRLAIDGG